MTNDDKRREMHEALDATLDPKAYRKLLQDVEVDTKTAHDYEKLQSVDGALKEARMPPEPVPRRMAANIMAKIAQAEALPTPQPLKSGMALAVGLSLGAMVGFTGMVLLSWGILSLFGTGTALSGFALGVIGVAIGLYSLFQGAGAFAANHFYLIASALLLIPLAAYGLHCTKLPPEKGGGDV